MASATRERPAGARRIGSVIIEERIAVGGMAEVFRGRRDGAAVVVKVLLPHHAREEEVKALFEHEAALGERLRHPNLIPVLEHGVAAEGPFLVSPHVAGASLAEVAREGALGPAAVAAVALDLLDALGFVHGAADAGGEALGIVHRDVSPDNVMVDREGRAHLIDFGVAKSALRSGRTRTGVVRGKAAYLAPEQATGSSVDARTDLYALAMVLFELATGSPYLEGDSDVAILRSAEEPRLRLPSAHGADARLDAPLRRALARFPEERPANAAAIREGFASLSAEAKREGRAELAARVHAIVGDVETPRRDGAPPARRGGLVAAGVGLIALGALWFGLRASEAPASLQVATAIQGSAAPDRAPVPAPAPAPVVPEPTASASSPRASALPPPPEASSAPPPPELAPSSSAPPAGPDRASVQQKMAEVNRRIAAAKAHGKDVSAAQARIPAALDAYLDGRYAQADRDLDAILALPL